MNSEREVSVPTDIPSPLQEIPDPHENGLTFCISDTTYTIISEDTCDSISLDYSVSSASLYMGNPNLHDCHNIPTGTNLCIPLSCGPTYTLKDNDTWISIEASLNLPYSIGATLRKFNPWLRNDCSNLQVASEEVYGHVLCGAPQGGTATGTSPPPGVTSLPHTGFAQIAPPANATVAEGTMLRCGRWYVMTSTADVSCTMLCLLGPIDREIFLNANLSLAGGDCYSLLAVGNAYCTGPVAGLNIPIEDDNVEEPDTETA